MWCAGANLRKLRSVGWEKSFSARITGVVVLQPAGTALKIANGFAATQEPPAIRYATGTRGWGT